jgi:hypothetical protein
MHIDTPSQWHALDFINRHASSLSVLTLTIHSPNGYYYLATESTTSNPSYGIPQQKLPQMILKSLLIQCFEPQRRSNEVVIQDISRLATELTVVSAHTLTRPELRYHLSTRVIQDLVHAIGRYSNNLRILFITPWSINPQLLQSLADSLPKLQELSVSCVQAFIGDSMKEHEEVQKIMERSYFIDAVSTTSPLVC